MDMYNSREPTFKRWPRLGRRALILLAASLLALAVLAADRSGAESSADAIYYVSVANGVDQAGCGTQSRPCKSIQYAINNRISASGDVIQVAAGTYTYQGDNNPCTQYLAARAVVCLANKKATIRGGYSLDWNTQNSAQFPTVIDGQNQYRGVYVQSPDKNHPSTAGIVMEGVTIRNGYTRCADNVPGTGTCAFGGGMLTDYASVNLKNMRFETNRVLGNNSRIGGSASGGGLAIRVTVGTATLEDIIFVGNSATAGNGSTRAGYSLGGGLYVLLGTVNGNNLQFYENRSTSGDSSGNGMLDGEIGDAFGAAATVMGGSTVTLENVIAHNNVTQGGRGNQFSGGAFGGAFKAEGAPALGEPVTFTLINADIRNNIARGGNSLSQSAVAESIGGLAAGGAVESIHANVNIFNSVIIGNSSLAGDGRTQGAAGGGGLYFQNIFEGSGVAVVRNSIVADNRARSGQGGVQGGGGGGIWLQGIRATISQSTIVGNQLETVPMQGAGILVMSDGVQTGPKPATIEYNIIANNGGEGEVYAVHTKLQNTANLNHNLFAGNEGTINTWEVGTVNGMDTSLVVDDAIFISPGAPDYNYNISFASPAVNLADGSAVATDIDGDPRLGVPDAGAQEAAPFRVLIAPMDQSLRVQWGNNPGVLSYDMTVTCPSGADAPNEVGCGSTRNYGGQSTGAMLTGLTNYVRYSVAVTPILPNGERISPTVVAAVPTDHLVYVPMATRE